MVRTMTVWQLVGDIIVRRVPAAMFLFFALASFVIARAGSFSNTVSGAAVMFIGLAMVIAFAVAGVWFLIKPPESLREFFRDRLYGTLMLVLPILVGGIAVGFNRDFPTTDAGMFARYYICMMLAVASAIAAFFLIKGERL